MTTAEGDPTAIGVQEAVFSRRATGLVRLGTPWRIIVLNFANIGLTYVMFTYWITPAVFPQSNLYLSLLIAGALNVAFASASTDALKVKPISSEGGVQAMFALA